MMTPAEARGRLIVIRKHLKTPRLMWHNDIGPEGDMYRAIDEIVSFLEDALA